MRVTVRELKHMNAPPVRDEHSRLRKLISVRGRRHLQHIQTLLIRQTNTPRNTTMGNLMGCSRMEEASLS